MFGTGQKPSMATIERLHGAVEDIFFSSFFFVQALFCLFEGAREEGKIWSLDKAIPIQPGVVVVVLGSQGDHWAEAQSRCHRKIAPHKSSPSKGKTEEG